MYQFLLCSKMAQLYILIHTFSFVFFSLIVYHRILNTLVLYSKTLFFIHLVYNGLHLLIPNFQSIPPWHHFLGGVCKIRSEGESTSWILKIQSIWTGDTWTAVHLHYFSLHFHFISSSDWLSSCSWNGFLVITIV